MTQRLFQIALVVFCQALFCLTPDKAYGTNIGNNVDIQQIDSIRLVGLDIVRTNTDSAICIIKMAINRAKEIKDDNRVAKGLNCLGIAYSIKGEYEQSFDMYRRALKLVEEGQDYILISGIYNNQGVVFESIRLYELAEKSYLKAAAYLKYVKGGDKWKFLNNTLSNIALVCRYKKEYGRANYYFEEANRALDSVSLGLPLKTFRKARSMVEMGWVAYLQGDIGRTKGLFRQYGSEVIKYKDYKATSEYYSYLGQLYLSQGMIDSAKLYLGRSEKLADSLDNKLLKAELYKYFAILYAKTGEYSKVLEHLEQREKLQEYLYGNTTSWHIYELRQAHKDERQKQELALIKKEKEVAKASGYLYLALIMSLMLFGVMYVRGIRAKFRKARELDALALKQTKEILKVKNKELFTAALKTVEHGEIMEQLRDGLKGISREASTEQKKTLDRLTKSIDISSEKNWKEFKLRFEQVNEGFYETLKAEFPNLTANEIKLCSFLKLNFNSKDIAYLLGISPESVKMGRYRLRKKLNLERDTNLVEFVSKF